MSAASLAIVGAGISGTAAARSAAQAGIAVHLFDRFSIDLAGNDAESITLYPETPVWGLFPGWQIAASHGTEPVIANVDAVLLANGSFDRIPAFSGSTRPGVLTASGLAALVERWQLLPGQRFVLIGDEPELTQSAEVIRRAGGEVVLVIPGSSARSAEIIGEPGVTGVRFDGMHHHADCVVVAAGILPDLVLAGMAGCDLVFDNDRQIWRLDVDGEQRTTVSAIWAAGSVAGDADAEASGRRAAQSIIAALSSGHLSSERRPGSNTLTTFRQPWRFDERIGAEIAG